MLSRLSIFFAAAVILSSSGCGDSSGEKPAKVFTVSGQVTWKDSPVVGADVTFFNPDAKRSAFGRTDEKGFFELTTFSSNDGAVEGRHTITVMKVEAPVESEPVASIESEAYVPPGMNKSTKPVKPKVLLPELYSSQATTTLMGVVEPKDGNVIDLELK